MGTEMVAFIEYDESEYNSIIAKEEVASKEYFAEDIYSVSKGGGMYTGSKDYVFFTAIAGVRNNTKIEPLFQPRGLPNNRSLPLQRTVDEGIFEDLKSVSYLNSSEIKLALNHFGVNIKDLHFETITILNVIDDLEKRLGKDRVRLVFGFQ